MADKILFQRLHEAVFEKYIEQKSAAIAMGFKDSSPLTVLLQRDPKKVRSDSFVRIKRAFPEYNLDWFKGNSDQKFLPNNQSPYEKPNDNTESYLKTRIKDLEEKVEIISVLAQERKEEITKLRQELEKREKTGQDFIND